MKEKVIQNEVKECKKEFRIGFCDMWDSFRADYNIFTLMVESSLSGAKVKEKVNIKGIDLKNVKEGEEDVDVVIFGPFGSPARWRSVKKGIPLVHYTGENSEPVVEAQLNLGYKHRNGNDGSYIRLPLWMLEINWFRADPEKIGNPKPLPINRCCKVYEEERETRNKFCAFVVTNPRNTMRNSAFHWLSNYKQVDSAGRLYNNIGDEIFAGLGGGGGELKKHEFLKQYKFCLAYENESSDGYTTEKYLHAKAAGCIPIYWGDPKFERDFDLEGCIDARDCLTSGDLVRRVKEIDENEELWKKKYNVPALDEVKRDLVRRTLSEVSKKILELMGASREILDSVPRFIGYTSDSEIQNIKQEVIEKKDINVLTTACNTNFLPALEVWMRSISAHRDVMKNIEVIIYFMKDVSKESEEEFKKKYNFIEVRRIPTEAPEDFKDMWEVKHFAWKVWILKELVKEEAQKGKLIFYMDTGMMLCRWPSPWLNKVKEKGICVLEDPRQINDRWCHELFKRKLNMTKEELDGQQIWAGVMAFISGDSLAKNLMEEAWEWAEERDVIVGLKFTSETTDEFLSTGHRHDQSIFSVLTQRKNVERYPLDNIYNDVSLRHTYMKGCYIYAHRGFFRVHDQAATGIDDVFLINLDRRKDRLERFNKTHPDLEKRILRMRAIDSKKLSLTPKLARLFMPHDFNWKKSVMGCALSHLTVWMELLNDKPEVNTYLILEDDVRLDKKWRSAWEEAQREKAIPEDFDVVYLGGILPPNKEGFESCVEKVNHYVGRVKENTVFGQKEPNRYFHFCAYAYVLSKKGAMKIIEFLKSKNGYWTSADHMICNLVGFMNMYFLHPLQATCYQEDDPVYCSSAFNDFSRKDTFDSDLWNNTERFSEEEVKSILDINAPLDILGALEDATRMNSQKEVEIKKEVESKEDKKVVERKEEVQKFSQPEIKNMNINTNMNGKRRFVNLARPKSRIENWLEYYWFKQIFHDNAGISLEVDRLDPDNCPLDEEPIVILHRPIIEESIKILDELRKKGFKFYVLHMMDELKTDPIHFYEWPECLGVIRNYVREDIGENPKVKVIPLGFHWAIPDGQVLHHTPRVPFREFVWSFVGTKWCNREEKINKLEGVRGDKKCVFMDTWRSKNMLGREETLSILLNSWFVPCPGGNNIETYRFYEALEAGAVPVIVKEEGCESYYNYLRKSLPIVIVESWEKAGLFIQVMKDQPQIYEQYRIDLINAWERMKEGVKKDVRDIFRL
jgi:GR25 family glycosyltransferase involved in LPS biosynthesis